MNKRIAQLATQLQRDGYVDNEFDATLAAIRILLAHSELPEGDDDKHADHRDRDDGVDGSDQAPAQ